MATSFMYILKLILFMLCIHLCSCYDQETMSRVKRQAPMGTESCMQIYTVPKQIVRCDPSQETVNNIVDIRSVLEDHKNTMTEMNSRIDSLDPDKPRELPEEVKERLSTIDDVKVTQAGHGEYLKRLETEIGHLLDRIKSMEASDREELARLIELQTKLIQVTLRQSNVSLHDEYLDKLSDSTKDLTSRLHQLELDLRDSVTNVQGKLETEVDQKHQENKEIMSEISKTLQEKFQLLEKGLIQESTRRSEYQNKTVLNENKMTTLKEVFKNVKQQLDSLKDREQTLIHQSSELNSTLRTTMEEKEQLQDKVGLLQVSLEALLGRFTAVKDEVERCGKTTGTLMRELAGLREQVKQREHILPRTLKVGDCQDALQFFHPTSGVYTINPRAVDQPFDVYCDMNQTAGWTVIQRRQNGDLDFYRGWNEYKLGFGDIQGEYWLGLDKIHSLTSKKPYSLRIDMQDWTGHWWYAIYDHFSIDREQKNFTLHVGNYHGDAGDSLGYHNGMGFSTFDNNHDKNDGICAQWCHGGWWYRDCFHANLNGRYYTEGEYTSKTGWGDGVVWKNIFKTNYYSLKSSIMKIKPADFTVSNKIDEM